MNLRTIVGPEGRGVPGSFHPEDNPHYLIDPVEGIKAAASVAAKLSALRPDQAADFENNYRVLAREVMVSKLGDAIGSSIPAERFEAAAIAVERGELQSFLEAEELAGMMLGGWLGKFEAYRDRAVVGDHDLWPYFARRYGVRVVGYLEPEPGVPPTVPHLMRLMESMRERDARIILTVPYFDPRHAGFVAERTGAAIVPMANNPGSRPGTEAYIDFVDFNARTLFSALESSRGAAQP